MQLYTYYRSSAAYRVRIALNLKQINYEKIAINLAAGEDRDSSYRSVNPQGFVPALVLDDGTLLTQSLAIIDYLEEQYPDPPLLAPDPITQAQQKALALSIACDIHPLNNLRVLHYLEQSFHVDARAREEWYRHWIQETFVVLERQVQGPYCFGDSLSIADVCLIPQVFNAIRFKVDMTAFPRLFNIYQHCNTLPAFAEAAPERQADAV